MVLHTSEYKKETKRKYKTTNKWKKVKGIEKGK